MGEGLEKGSSLSGEELAFLGDGVYELLVRKHVVGKNIHKAKDVSNEANKYSCAAFQARAAKVLFEDHFTEEEQKVFIRGRNLSHKNYPKSVSKMEYKYATALECVFGWLSYLENEERIEELFSLILDNNEGGTNEL